MFRKSFILTTLLLIGALLLTACAQTPAPPQEEPPPTTEAVEPTPTQAEPTAAPEVKEEVEPTEETMVEEKEEAPVEPAAPRILKVAATSSVTTWDPSASFSTEAIYMANIYEPLLWVNPPGSGEPFTPALAESWEISEDGTEWVFHLREGVKFHDGESLTAEAVKKSLERTIELGRGAAYIWGAVDTIEAVDDLTVKITLTAPAPLDRIAGSLYASWIMSPKAAEQDTEWFEEGNEAGSGPYTLASYEPDAEVVLQAFEAYWGGWEDNQFKTVVVSIVPEQVVQQQMLEGGEVDLALAIPLESVDDFRNNPNYTVNQNTSFANYVGLLNTQKPPLDNKLIRQAIAYAIPYEDIITVAAEGFAAQARGPVPTGLWPYNDEVFQYHQDLDKARELLAEAGYAEGGFELVLTHAAENVQEEKFAPLVKDALAQLGIEVDIQPMLWEQQWELAQGSPAEAQDIFLLLWWPTYSDGYDNLYSMFHSEDSPFFNLGYYSNPDFDTLIDEAHALTSVDPDTSLVKYNEALDILMEDSPSLFFYDVQAVVITPNHIQGYAYNINYPAVTFFYPLRAAD